MVYTLPFTGKGVVKGRNKRLSGNNKRNYKPKQQRGMES